MLLLIATGAATASTATDRGDRTAAAVLVGFATDAVVTLGGA